MKTLRLNDILNVVKERNSVKEEEPSISLDSASIEKIASEVESLISSLEEPAQTEKVQVDDLAEKMANALKAKATEVKEQSKTEAISNVLNAATKAKEVEKDNIRDFLINSLLNPSTSESTSYSLEEDEEPQVKAAADVSTLKLKFLESLKSGSEE